jgi:hypothetical protein
MRVIVFAYTTIVDAIVLTESPATPMSDEVAGAIMLIVAAEPPAPVDWESEIGPEPTRTTLPVVTVPVEPAVLPKVETPSPTPPPPPPPPPDAVMVDPWRPKEIPLAFEKTTEPRFPEVVPAEKLTGAPATLFPEITIEPFETPTEIAPAPWTKSEPIEAVPELNCVVFPVAYIDWLIPVEPGAEIRTDPCERPTEMIPAPTKVKDRASRVDELDWPVDWDDA